MIDQQHPITPPPELVEQRWNRPQVGGDFAQEFAAFFAQWGADQELEACCKWLPKLPPWSADDLRKHRRPKPQSLKDKLKEAIYSENLDEALCLVEQLDD